MLIPTRRFPKEAIVLQARSLQRKTKNLLYLGFQDGQLEALRMRSFHGIFAALHFLKVQDEGSAFQGIIPFTKQRQLAIADEAPAFEAAVVLEGKGRVIVTERRIDPV